MSVKNRGWGWHVRRRVDGKMHQEYFPKNQARRARARDRELALAQAAAAVKRRKARPVYRKSPGATGIRGVTLHHRAPGYWGFNVQTSKVCARRSIARLGLDKACSEVAALLARAHPEVKRAAVARTIKRAARRRMRR